MEYVDLNSQLSQIDVIVAFVSEVHEIPAGWQQLTCHVGKSRGCIIITVLLLRKQKGKDSRVCTCKSNVSS